MATTPPRKAAKATSTGPKKPAPKGTAKSADSFLGWLGRQVGHVKHAVGTDVTKPARKEKTSANAGKKDAAQTQPASKVIYRDDKIEQVEHPTQPGVVLRRTIIDEVIVDEEKQGKSS